MLLVPTGPEGAATYRGERVVPLILRLPHRPLWGG